MIEMTPSDALSSFTEAFGPGEQYAPYTKDDAKRLGERLPEVVRLLLARDGWCSYKDEVLWTCDPDVWKSATGAWFPKQPDAQALARTAFGDLLVLAGGNMRMAMPHEGSVLPEMNEPDWFFGLDIVQPDFKTQSSLPARVRAARKSAGRLAPDEMYTYVPALASGGTRETSKIARVKAAEQLSFLSQLGPIRELR